MLAGYLEHCVDLMGGVSFIAEPFCGGAGASLALLAEDKVPEIHINDADTRIFSAWMAILHETDRFIEDINSAHLDMATWHRHRAILERGDPGYELGFATFYLNRTSRSGIIDRSGPIGGYEQNSKWNLGARFYRETLTERVRKVAALKDRINVTNSDGLAFLYSHGKVKHAPAGLYFIDPPYVRAGDRLYYNTMNDGKHEALADLLKMKVIENWVLTYDEHPLILQVYGVFKPRRMDIGYSLQTKRKATEVIMQHLPAAVAEAALAAE